MLVDAQIPLRLLRREPAPPRAGRCLIGQSLPRALFGRCILRSVQCHATSSCALLDASARTTQCGLSRGAPFAAERPTPPPPLGPPLPANRCIRALGQPTPRGRFPTATLPHRCNRAG